MGGTGNMAAPAGEWKMMLHSARKYSKVR